MNGDKCKALYDYSEADTDLMLRKGDIIEIISISQDGWFTGCKANKEKGIFPINYTEYLKPKEFIMSILCLSIEDRKVENQILSKVLCKVITNLNQYITEKYVEEFNYIKAIIKKNYSYAIRGLPEIPDKDINLSTRNTYLSYLLQCPLLLSVINLWTRCHFHPIQSTMKGKLQQLYVVEERDTPLKVYFPHLGQLQKFDETMTLPVNRNPSLINLISIPEVVYGDYIPRTGYERCRSISLPTKIIEDTSKFGYGMAYLIQNKTSNQYPENVFVRVSYKGYVWCPAGMVILEFDCMNNGKYTIGGHVLVEGLERAIEKMKPKERCIVLLSPRLAYGQEGNISKGVPERAYLLYDVTLNAVEGY